MVITLGATEIGTNSATLNMSTDLGDLTGVVSMGFLVSKTNDFTSSTRFKRTPDFGNVNMAAYGLDANQLYYLKAFFEQAGEAFEYGNVVSFYTNVAVTSDLSTRPHVMKWRTKDGAILIDENGYESPGIPGQSVETPCRYHSGGGKSGRKSYMIDDGTTVIQQGTIRVDVGQDLPQVGDLVVVEGFFSGPVREVYEGQLTHRIDV